MCVVFWVGCVVLLLLVCSSEFVQQVIVVYVLSGMKVVMFSVGEVNCVMIGGLFLVVWQFDGLVIGMCVLFNGKCCSEQLFVVGSCGSY